MSLTKNYIIIIPARGGSKRFPGKNIALLDGIPLISHSIRFAKEIKLDKIIDIYVNTDDDSIEKIALEEGVKVYRRPKVLGGDFISTAEVLSEQLGQLNSDNTIDAVILLQATNPFRTVEVMNMCLNIFEKENADSVATFSKLNKKFGKIVNNSFSPENYEFGQRMQDLIPRYYENGLIYITKSESIMRNIILTENVKPIILDDISAEVDVDEINDLHYAEFIINIKKNE